MSRMDERAVRQVTENARASSGKNYGNTETDRYKQM